MRRFMNKQSYFENAKEEKQFWSGFGYSNHEMIYCPMCGDTHENNSLCQMPVEGDSYEIC